MFIDRFSVNLSAGNGNIQWIVDKKDPIAFRAKWFQARHLKPENCKALYVKGRSMEKELKDGDTVMIDTSKTDIIDGEIYAVALGDEFFIKTIERIANGIRLKSENRDFTDIDVTGNRLDDLTIIGLKVWRAG